MGCTSSSPVDGDVAVPPTNTASTIVFEDVQGSHVLKIGGYSRTKGIGVGMFFLSGSFDVGGHSFCIKYYPDGFSDADADWISIFLCLDKSSHANEVKARFVFSLLDQQDGEPVSSYSKRSTIIRRVTKTGSGSWGFRQFMEKKALEESIYLKYDSFRIRFDVTVLREICREDTTRRLVTVPPSDMHRHLGWLLSTSEAVDVTFHVGNETFAAHRCVLAARSPVFRAELLGPMKEKTTAVIRIDDVEAEVFKAMLHFIYTDMMPEITNEEKVEMAQHLLVAADTYALERLKLICEDKLCDQIDTRTAATTLALAEQHGCRELKEACLLFLASPINFKAVMVNDGFEHLKRSCPTLLMELFANMSA